jgi:hypothetical protein
MDSNPVSGVDICPHHSVLCCPVYNESDWKNRKMDKRGGNMKEVDSVYAAGTGSVPKLTLFITSFQPWLQGDFRITVTVTVMALPKMKGRKFNRSMKIKSRS